MGFEKKPQNQGSSEDKKLDEGVLSRRKFLVGGTLMAGGVGAMAQEPTQPRVEGGEGREVLKRHFLTYAETSSGERISIELLFKPLPPNTEFVPPELMIMRISGEDRKVIKVEQSAVRSGPRLFYIEGPKPGETEVVAWGGTNAKWYSYTLSNGTRVPIKPW